MRLIIAPANYSGSRSEIEASSSFKTTEEKICFAREVEKNELPHLFSVWGDKDVGLEAIILLVASNKTTCIETMLIGIPAAGIACLAGYVLQALIG